MAIEFRCSQCSQLLRVPDNSAGKNARCPKCQALMTVPGEAAVEPPGDVTSRPPGAAVFPPPPPFVPAAAPPMPPVTPPPSDAFAGTQPMSAPPTPPKPAFENPFGASSGGASPPSANPYASPAAADYYYTQQYIPFGPRPGLPWERERPSFGCWFRTMGTVIGQPTQAFSMMHQYGGLGTPLLYNAYAVGMLLALGMMIAVPILVVLGIIAAQNNNGGQILAVGGIGAAIAIAFIIFYSLMVTVVTPFIWAAICHVTLMMVGGARHGFETTFRVICYGYFSTILPGMFVGLVPYLGGLVVMVWIIVLLIIGLSRAHETTGGKAAAAVLLPIGVCCGLYIAFAVVFIGGPAMIEAMKGR
jgi:phage FluMu protein Com